MSLPVVIFSHGQESGPWGTKIRSMAENVRALGYEADSVDYQGISDSKERVDKLIDVCKKIDGPVVLIGSSMGGYVATAAASHVRAAGLFVLAPAYYMPGLENLTPTAPDIPICIVHGWRDDIVPVENSIRFAKDCAATLHVIDGDHRLTNKLDEINYLLTRFIDGLSKN
ncbi:MAG: alpha/beta fold hydrolase [Proteobacteria bacterium]|nr:alpha/beta fold hydrolase [Pseudomonadota bacterium]MDA0992728.1 alpha/beta fold hydrolase [Pseudomonadota bacterium]